MKHITIDEILDFVSIERMDAKSLELASKITTHIRECDDCLQKVRAFQNVYEGIKTEDRRLSIKNCVQDTEGYTQIVEEVSNQLKKRQQELKKTRYFYPSDKSR